VRDGEDVARDVAAVRGEEAIEVRMHLPEIDAAFDGIGQLFICDGVEVEQLPLHDDVGVAFHRRRHEPADEAHQGHHGEREHQRIDRQPSEGRGVPAA